MERRVYGEGGNQILRFTKEFFRSNTSKQLRFPLYTRQRFRLMV